MSPTVLVSKVLSLSELKLRRRPLMVNILTPVYKSTYFLLMEGVFLCTLLNPFEVVHGECSCLTPIRIHETRFTTSIYVFNDCVRSFLDNYGPFFSMSLNILWWLSPCVCLTDECL